MWHNRLPVWADSARLSVWSKTLSSYLDICFSVSTQACNIESLFTYYVQYLPHSAKASLQHLATATHRHQG